MLHSSGFRHILLSLGLGILLLLPGLGSVPIINGDEARFAQAAREMASDSNWVLPTFGGRPRYDKPILIYWATKGSYSLFGETPFAARFPSALATLAAALLLAAWIGGRWGSRKAIQGAFLFLATPLIYLEAHACTADALNNLWILAAMLSLLEILRGNQKYLPRILLWVSTALALLTKGPVVLLVIGGTLLGMQALRRQWKQWEVIVGAILVVGAAAGGGPLLLLPMLLLLGADFLRRENSAGRALWGPHLLWGPLLAIALMLPWAMAAHRATGGEFFRVALGHHVIGRSLSTLEHHQGFPGIYVLSFFMLAFPWAARLPAALRKQWKLRRDSLETLFLLGWLLGPLLILECLKTRLVHYEMPLLAAGILLLLGEKQRFSRALLLAGGTLLAATTLIPALHFEVQNLLFFAILLAMLVLIPMGACLIKPESQRTGAWLQAASALFLIALFGVYLPHFSHSFIGARTLDAARRLAFPGDDFVIYKLRDEDLLFSFPVGTRVLRSPEELIEYLRRPARSILITREKDWERVDFGAKRRPAHADFKVRGLDLGRGKWVTALCFRLGSTGPPGADS